MPRPGEPASSAQLREDYQAELDRLLAFADHDHDKKITVDDFPKGEVPPSYHFHPPGAPDFFDINGVYQLSNLLQELTLAKRGQPFKIEDVFEAPSVHISRAIRERYWSSLTRRFDVASLPRLLPDSKLKAAPFYYLYVPSGDGESLDYYRKLAVEKPELKMEVRTVNEPLNEAEINRIAREPQGLLALRRDVPFVVPGGRFNEMYGWDSYFESLGLIEDGRVDLAKSMVDQFVYEIAHYGKILNANRTYYLNRSQPPFLTSMIRAVADALPAGAEKEEWVRKGMEAAVREYTTVWMGPDRLTTTGLSRYYGSGHGIPPEVEAGAFDFILKPVATRRKITVEALVAGYNLGRIQDRELDHFFENDRAVRESGHDTTYRWRVGHADRAADFVTVDLNALLYKYELDLARWFGHDRHDVGAAQAWRARAEKRRRLMLKYLWSPKRKLFADYNFKTGQASRYVSATAFYPFWAENPDEPKTWFLPAAQAVESLETLVADLEAPGGLAATSQASLESVKDRPVQRQWDFPNGWAPHQMIAWTALAHHHQIQTEQRIAFAWLEMITRNASRYNGTIPEKYDVVKRSHAVFSEYGNVGTQFSYITAEGFGWMNASYQVGLKILTPQQREKLDRAQ